jgi:hypothetical protein
MDRSVDRLSVVCKTLLDQRFLDMRQENEELRAESAWNKYGEEVLDKWMPSVNQVYIDEVCTCKSCFLSGRFEMARLDNIYRPYAIHGYDGLKESHECIIKKCLILQAEKLGLRVLQFSRDTYTSYVDPHQMDCHIVVVNAFGTWYIKYGAMLSVTNFHTNPDLEKIKSLFELCRDGNEFFSDGLKDYAE